MIARLLSSSLPSFGFAALLLLSGALLPSDGLLAQASGKEACSIAAKRERAARGLKGPERAEVLEAALKLWLAVPERFADDAPSVAKAQLRAGRLERRLARPEKALVLLKAAADQKAAPKIACDALHELATLHRKAKRTEDMVACLERIVAEHPDQSTGRSKALLKLASVAQRAKAFDQQAAYLKQVLAEHGERWRATVDALDALVRLERGRGATGEADRLLKVHLEAMRKRFAGTKSEARLEAAIAKMKCMRDAAAQG